jgi:hypothetical protein
VNEAYDMKQAWDAGAAGGMGPRGGGRRGWSMSHWSGVEPEREARSRHEVWGAASGRGPEVGRPSANLSDTIWQDINLTYCFSHSGR